MIFKSGLMDEQATRLTSATDIASQQSSWQYNYVYTIYDKINED